MARCEDFPCCGHEAGCCPDYDDAGRQLNMKCVCGATVPLDSKVSCCSRCMRLDDDFDDCYIEPNDWPEFGDDRDFDEFDEFEFDEFDRNDFFEDN